STGPGTGTPSLSRYDTGTRKRTAYLPEDPDQVGYVFSALSPDGRFAVMSIPLFNARDQQRYFELHLVDTATFAEVRAPLPGLAGKLAEAPPTRLSFSPDGRYVAAVTDNDYPGPSSGIEPIALVWDVTKGGPPVVQYHFAAEPGQRDVAFV